MKTMSWKNYGVIDDIKIVDQPMPIPRYDEILIAVHASSINSWDWEILQGTPWVNRAVRFFTSKYDVLGADVAGHVEAVGSKVTQFKPGDAVYGDLSAYRWGGFAEYVLASEVCLRPKPVNLSYQQAAAVPQAGLLALQGLRDKGRLQEGEKLLINGASGGVGSFAVQLAKLWGAEVTAVCCGNKMDMVRHLGADEVIDYTQQDFTRNGQQYDLILDIQGHHSVADYKRALAPKGRYVMVGGEGALATRMMWKGLWSVLGYGRSMGLLLHQANKGLGELTELLDSQQIEPVIDRHYSLEQLPEAMEYYGAGRTRGKLVITMGKF